MKVALLGNMNNMGFSTVRHLRAAGVDAHLFLFDDTPPHFHPSQDSFTRDYEAYTTALPFGRWDTFAETPAHAIADAVRGFDFTIGMGTAPALLARAGLKLDVFFPYGDDIVSFPFWLGTPRRSNFRSVFGLPRWQRAGIRDAAVCIGAKTPRDDALYAKLGYTGKRIIVVPPLVCSLELDAATLAENAQKSPHYASFAALRAEANVLAFSHSRIAIAKTLNYKGTEKVIAGFAAFVHAHPELRARLALLEYGPDVSDARAMVRALGIQANVRWFPLMARKDLMLGLSLADIAFGELGYSYLTGGAITECVVMGKPMIHYRDDALYPKEDLFPILPASTVRDVTAQLERYLADPEGARAVGLAGERAFRARMTDLSIDVLVKLVDEKRRTGRVTAESIDPALFLSLADAGDVPALGTERLGLVGPFLRRLIHGF